MSHYGALILQSIDEKLGPALGNRHPYEQRLFDSILRQRFTNGELIPSVLRLLVYSDNLLVPNVDISPGELCQGDHPVIQLSAGSGYVASEDCLKCMLDYTALAVKHPIARDLALSAESYRDAVQRLLGFKKYPNLAKEQALGNQVVAVSAILQELRSVMNIARKRGIPAVSSALDQWNGATVIPADDQLAVLQLYFNSAIYSPKPRSIKEALDLRSHPRIEKWRSTMREWSSQLSKGSMTKSEIINAVDEANGYIEGAEFIKNLIPNWSVYVTLPIGVLKAIFGAPLVVTGGLLMLSGINCYGKLIWASVTGSDPLQNGWYLVSDTR